MKHCRLVFVLFIIVGPLFSQPVRTDSARTYPLKEVVVTATRSPIAAGDAPSQITVLTSRDIDNANAATVADLLGQAGGVFLRQNGGGGSIATLSMRGGASEHLLVLMNGIRYNNFQNGLVDLNLLPVQNIDRIEMVNGGNSALYGSDAVAGVVNILTKEPGGKPGFRALFGLGSFGGEQYVVEGASTLGAVGVLAGFSSDRGTDNYSFADASSAGGSDARTNADFARRQFYLHGNLRIDDRSKIRVAVQNVSSDRGSPGPYTGAAGSAARLFDNDLHVSANCSRAVGAQFEWTVGAAYHYGYETYRDPDPLYPYETFYKNNSFNFNEQVRWEPIPSQKLTFGWEYMRGGLESPDFDSAISRAQSSVYLSHEARLDADRPFLNRFSIFTTARFDQVTDGDHAFTPKFGMNILILPEGDVHIRSTVGRSFRSPSFNDLYFRGFSNPDLRPEHSTSFDAGVSASWAAAGDQSLEVTYFHLDTDDRILFDPIAFAPKNIGQVKSSGLELTYSAALFHRGVNIRVNYSYTNALKMNQDSLNDPTFEKQLTYVPKEILNVSLSATLRPFTINVAYLVVGERFTSSDDATSVPAYRLVNQNVVLRPMIGEWNVYVKGEVNNLFDVDYQIYRSYPMSKRSYRFTVGVEY